MPLKIIRLAPDGVTERVYEFASYDDAVKSGFFILERTDNGTNLRTVASVGSSD